MIAEGTEEQPLDTYARETLQRLPLADATLSLWAYVLQPTFLAQVFAEHRGRSFEETLTFGRFVDLIGDALVEHKGSGRQSFTRAQEQGTLATSSEAVYGKLRRVPLSLSLGFFAEGTARLRALLPPQHLAVEFPASLAALTVVVGDGKTLKRVAKRLLPARGAAGNYGDIAIGPRGEVMVVYGPANGSSGGTLELNVKADGLGPSPFGPPIAATATHVGGFDFIPTQPDWGIDPP